MSPVNTMLAAKEIDGLTFVPSENLADLAENNGIAAEEVVDEPEDEDMGFIKASNNFWKNKIIQYFQENGYLDSKGHVTGNPAYDDLTFESTYSKYSRRKRLNEGRKSDIKLEHKTSRNVNTKQLQEMLLNQFISIQEGATKNRATNPIPICIWGAPGTGKTRIVSTLIDEFRDEGLNANMISINAQAMRKDDWALPGHKTSFKNVKNDRGEDIQIAVDTAIELPKSWLPTYDKNDIDEANGITEDVLDDIANGGDGSGNGDGGFFFIDELSRISPDVNNVIMTLLQERTFQGKRIGSKWMFVAAANRSGDLGGNATRFTWDSAQTDRFLHVNFVPTFEEWRECAESPIRGTNMPHIEPILVQFLSEHQTFWYNSTLRAEDDDDLVASTLAPRGRTWEVITKYLREIRQGTTDPRLAKIKKKMGMDPSGREPTTQDVVDGIRMQAGPKAADAFGKWGEFDAVFGLKNCKDVWQNGENAAIPFTPHSGTIIKALEKILAAPPKRAKVKVPGQSVERIPIKPEELENVVKYILKCIDRVSQSLGGAVDPVIQAVQERLYSIILQAPYYIDVQNPASPDVRTYAKALILLNKRKKQSANTVFGA
jgi:hypothetical protein